MRISNSLNRSGTGVRFSYKGQRKFLECKSAKEANWAKELSLFYSKTSKTVNVRYKDEHGNVKNTTYNAYRSKFYDVNTQETNQIEQCVKLVNSLSNDDQNEFFARVFSSKISKTRASKK